MSQHPLSDELAAEAVNALARFGNKSAAAKALGVPRETLRNRLKAAHKRGIGSLNKQHQIRHGYAPELGLNTAIPAPLVLKGTSTYYDKDGKQTGQWVKTTLDQEKLHSLMTATIEAMRDEIPRAEPVEHGSIGDVHLCNLYTLTDYHIGMNAWGKETGEDWDIRIAENLLYGAFSHIINSSPSAKTCVISQLGDFLHFDSLSPVTPTSGHVLDADSRYSKVVRVATKVLRYLVDTALRKHHRVIVIIAEGNHDMASSVWLRHLFSLLYENEPRVDVLDSELPYYCYQHGEVMLAFHHGHLRKFNEISHMIPAQFPRIWGATTKRYCHMGHHHHHAAKEGHGITIVQHATLAARDAYAARGGWFSDRKITSYTYHDLYGEVASNTVVPEMLPSMG